MTEEFNGFWDNSTPRQLSPFEEWAKGWKNELRNCDSVARAAFAAGAASRDAEIVELVEHLDRMLWYIDYAGDAMRHNEFQRFRNGKFNTDASSAAVEFNECFDGAVEAAKAALAKVRKPT